jgi:hypothetical protein
MLPRHHLVWIGFLLLAGARCSGDVSPQGATPVAGKGGGPGGSSGTGGSSGRGGSGATAGRGGSGSGSGGSSGGSGGTSAGSGGSSSRPPDAGARMDGGDPVDPPTVDPPAPPPQPGANPGSPPAGPPGPWAQALQVGLVEVSQATFVKLGQGAEIVAPAMRNAPLIEGRPLVVRVHVVPGAGFTPRTLRGVVAIEYGGAGGKQFEESKMIAGQSDPARTASTFNILIPAAEVKPGASLWAAVYESGTGAGPAPAPLPRFPAEGATDLAIKAGRMVLDVVGVPVTGPGGPLADSPERRKKLEDHLYDLYPVQRVNLKIRAPVQVTAMITERTAAFGLLRDARTADGASARPWEYYHLLVAREDTTFSFAGTAGGGGGSNNDPGSRRVALTLVRGRAVDGNTNTVAHELGHNHGQGHVPACGADGDGNGFPYMNGALGVNGWSLSENALKSAAMFKELMGYCRPRWISDWMYGRFEARVRMVSAMTAAPPTATTLAERSLLGYIGPGERPNWGVVAERLVEPGAAMLPQRYARLVMDDGRVIMAPVTVNVMSDGVTRELGVSLPEEGTVQKAQVQIDGQSLPIDVAGL